MIEDRVEQVNKGLKTLTEMEKACKHELEDSQKLCCDLRSTLLELVQRSCEENWLRVMKKYESTTQQFQALRASLQAFAEGKVDRLPESCVALCSGAPITPKFLRVAFENPSLMIGRSIIAACSIAGDSVEVALSYFDSNYRKEFISKLRSEAKQRSGRVAMEALNYAVALGDSGESKEVQIILLRESEEAVQVEELFTMDDSLMKKAAEALFMRGHAEKIAGRFTRSLKSLQRAWQLLQQLSGVEQESLAVGLLLSELLSYHFGKYDAALQILSICLQLVTTMNPWAEEGMAVHCKSCELLCACGRYTDAEEKARLVLEMYKGEQYGARHYWSILHSLVSSLLAQCKEAEVVELMAEWRKKRFDCECEEAMFTRACLFATVAMSQGKLEKAERVCPQGVSTTLLCATSLRIRGDVFMATKRQDGAEGLYKQAICAFQIAGPLTLDAAIALWRAGEVSCTHQHLAEAEELLQRALSVCLAVCPNTCLIADIEISLATVLRCAQRFSEAEEQLQLALAVCNGRQDKREAHVYEEMGVLFEEAKRFDEALKYYSLATSIYEKEYPRKAVTTMTRIGIIHRRMKRLQEALASLQRALATAEQVSTQLQETALTHWCLSMVQHSLNGGAFQPPSLQTATDELTLMEVGEMLMEAGRLDEAQKPLRTATASLLPLRKAFCYVNLGLISKELKHLPDAKQYLTAALTTLEAIAPASVLAAKANYLLALVYRDIEQAEKHHVVAAKLYEIADPKCVDRVRNLIDFSTLIHRKHVRKAEEYAQVAKTILDEAVLSEEEAAECHRDLDVLLGQLAQEQFDLRGRSSNPAPAPAESFHSLNVQELLQSAALVCLSTSSVQVYSFQKSQWSPTIALSTGIKCDVRTSYMLISEARVFCCGSSPQFLSSTQTAAKDAYLITLQPIRSEVDKLPVLNRGRSNPGLLFDRETFFVFGSLNDRSIEMLESSHLKWTLLEQEMSVYRSYFTPCVCSDKAYLCRAGDMSIDILDLSTRQMLKPLSVKLPQEHSDMSCVSVATDEALMILSRSYITMLDLQSLSIHAQTQPALEIRPASTPVFVDDWVYWVRKDGLLLRGNRDGREVWSRR